MEIKSILSDLESPDEFTRREACLRLGESGTSDAVRPLMAAFRDESWLVREAAVEGFIRLGGDRDLSLLLSVLSDQDARVRNSVIEILTGLGSKAVFAVMEALKNDDQNIVRYAADILGDIGDKRALKGLIDVLRTSTLDTQYYIILALGKLKDDSATDALLPFLDREVWLVTATVEALGNISDRKGTRRLVDLLESDPFIRPQVIEALGKIGDASAIPALLSCLEDGIPEINNAVIKAVVSIKEKAVSTFDIAGKYSIKEESITTACLSALESEDADLRKAAAVLLGWLKAKSAIDPLTKRLSDADEEMSSSAGSALIEIGADAVSPLISLLSIPEKRARLLTIKVLGDIGDKRAADSAISMLLDDDEDVRRAAAGVVGKIKPAQGLTPLLDLLGDVSGKVRQSAVEAITSYGMDETLYQNLRAMMKSGSPLIRRSAVEILGLKKELKAIREMELLLLDADPGVKQAAVFALARIENIKVGSIPIMLLGNDDPVLRKSAAIVLGELQDNRGVDPLCLTLRDRDMWVRFHSAQALGIIGDRRALGPLVEGLSDPVGLVKLSCIKALRQIGSLTHQDALIQLATDADEDVRSSVAEALSAFSSDNAFETLRELTHDSSWQVREAAALSISGFLPGAGRSEIEALLADSNHFVRESAREILSKV